MLHETRCDDRLACQLWAMEGDPDESGRPFDRPDDEAPEDLESMRLRLLLADDHRIIRESLASRLASEVDLEIVGQVEDGAAAVAEARRLCPDIVLMDISMPVMGGLEATRLIHKQQPATRVIALSMYERDEMEGRMIEAGADRYLSKAEPIERLLYAIRKVGGSHRYGC